MYTSGIKYVHVHQLLDTQGNQLKYVYLKK